MGTNGNINIMSIVGARPNFMKIAPIVAAITRYNNHERGDGMAIRHVLVHTGQHYDALMSDAFFRDLRLPIPDVSLGVGSGSHAGQTADIMKAFEKVLLQDKPDVLLVVGDVNSTIACTLVGAKISYDGNGRRPIIAHVEAGLRSFDRTMPEEINRIVTDRLSDVCFVTEASGITNLRNEGMLPGQIHFVGNTMIDSLLSHIARAEQSPIMAALGLRHASRSTDQKDAGPEPALLTLHRPSNVDRREQFGEIVEALEHFAGRITIVFPAHPRTVNRIKDMQLGKHFHFLEKGHAAVPGKLNVVEPLGYLDFLCLMKNARIVLTDSGGVQEETTCLGVPCVTIRENTERPVTVQEGTNVLAGTRKEAIIAAIEAQLARRTGEAKIPHYWDGKAAERIVDVLVRLNRQEN